MSDIKAKPIIRITQAGQSGPEICISTLPRSIRRQAYQHDINHDGWAQKHEWNNTLKALNQTIKNQKKIDPNQAKKQAQLLKTLNRSLKKSKKHKPIPSLNDHWWVVLENEKAIWNPRIEYQNFSGLHFNQVPTQPVALPERLSDILNQKDIFYKPNVVDAKQLKLLVLEEAAKLGYPPQKIKILKANVAVALAIAIVCKKLNYFLVDYDPNFIKQHGRNIAIDQLLSLGKGDCDKYTKALMAVFQIFKEMNPQLENVYISREYLGANPELDARHAWNTILLIWPNRIEFSHIDITYHDNHGELEGECGHHFPKDNNLMLAIFLKEIYEEEAAWVRYLNAFEYTDLPQEKIQLLGKMVSIASMQDDMGGLELIKNKMEQFSETKDYSLISRYDYVLFRLCELYEKNNEQKKFNHHKQQLEEIFPKGYWTLRMQEKTR